MAGSRQGARKRSRNSPEEAKRTILEQLSKGSTVKDALLVAQRSQGAYESYRRNDAVFRQAVDRIRADHLNTYQSEDRSGFPGFSEFSEMFLDAKVFPHGQNVIDLIEGREPSWLHPAMVYEAGERDLVIVNMPPEHAKSTTVTMNYVTWRIAKDPNIRVLIVSKTEAMASKFLYGIKTRLTHPKYSEFHVRYGPPGGYSDKAESWSQKMIYVSGDARDSGEKDPTVQALGIRGHIYGARADLIILDDCVDLSNAHEYEKQIDWIQSEVLSRIASTGSMLVVGTRLAAKDLYLELRDPRRYPDEVSPWTYLSMPAVLESADDPKDWLTLWPKSNQPEPGSHEDPDPDGLFPKWDGPRLAKKRGRMQPRSWALVYQQQQVTEDAIFQPEAIQASINGNRLAGVMPRGMVNCRPNGMDGLIVVAGMDPAMAGFTAAVVIGLDPATAKRYVLNVHNQQGMTPDQIRELIKSWTVTYGIQEWRIERNAFQSMLTQDREVTEFLTSRGCLLREHTTGRNKWDSEFGVASLSMLWAGWKDGMQLIELPSTHRSEATKSLVEQLVTWHPDAPKTQKTDVVMALWFTELACRDRIDAIAGSMRTHSRNPFMTRRDREAQQVISFWDESVQSMWQPM